MYDIKWVRDNSGVFDKGRERRGLEPLAEKLLALDDARRAAIAKLQAAQERRNAASKEIGQAMAAKDAARAEALKAEVAELKVSFAAYEAEERDSIAALDKALSEIPNLPLEDVPFGKDENDNPELRRVGEPPKFSFKPKEHFEIGEALGLMDFETAAKISGARFVVNKGPLARLERALGAFMLDLHQRAWLIPEVNPPILVKDEAMFGTAQLPKFFEDQFLAEAGGRLEAQKASSITNSWQGAVNFYDQHGIDELRHAAATGLEIVDFELSKDWSRFRLIPTAEVPLTNLVARKNPGRKRPASPRHRLHALLPRRGWLRWARHARHDSPASIHQGRACLHHDAGKLARRA